MPNEMYIFLGALVGAVVAYITAKTTSGIQLKIAENNSSKDIELQDERLFDERLKAEVGLERKKLEKLHMILSKISLENSQTMSYIQSDSDFELKDFRGRYLDNCERLHRAHAITDIYYPDMSESIRKIYGQSNLFWGHQEGVIRIDIQKNKQGWESNLSKVIEAGHEIADHVRQLQKQIAGRGRELNKALHRTGR